MKHPVCLAASLIPAVRSKQSRNYPGEVKRVHGGEYDEEQQQNIKAKGEHESEEALPENTAMTRDGISEATQQDPRRGVLRTDPSRRRVALHFWFCCADAAMQPSEYLAG